MGLFPFSGKVHIGYIPDTKLLDLSCVSNTLQVLSRRLQDQQRLTNQISDALEHALKPLGIAVVLLCDHSSSMMSSRTTSLKGCVKDDPVVRTEFLSFVKAQA